MTPATDADLPLMHRLADLAATISSSYARGRVSHGLKPDGSVVTEADLAVERALLDVLRDERPLDAVLAEETGAHGKAGASRRWLLDPIDGTTDFLAGRRSWGTHVALEVGGRVELAIITRPTERRCWWAARGSGAFARTTDGRGPDERLTVPSAARPHVRVGGFPAPGSDAVAAIEARHSWIDDDVSPVAALLEGRLDVVLDEGGEVWDQAPVALLVSEAGGSFLDVRGGARLDLRWSVAGVADAARTVWDLLVGGPLAS